MGQRRQRLARQPALLAADQLGPHPLHRAGEAQDILRRHRIVMAQRMAHLPRVDRDAVERQKLAERDQPVIVQRRRVGEGMGQFGAHRTLACREDRLITLRNSLARIIYSSRSSRFSPPRKKFRLMPL